MKFRNELRKYAVRLIVGSVTFLTNVFAEDSNWGPAASYGFSNQNTSYNPNVPGASEGLKNDSLLVAVKKFVNWVLWLLALIALGVLLWWGFQMVTAAGDDNKYKKWFTILKQAGIWLVLIGLAWLIVSLFFYIVSIMVG